MSNHVPPQPLPKAPPHPFIMKAVYLTITEQVKNIKRPRPTFRNFLHHSSSYAMVSRMLILAEEKK